MVDFSRSRKYHSTRESYLDIVNTRFKLIPLLDVMEDQYTFGCVNCWVSCWVWVKVNPIEINTSLICSVVTSGYSVRVEHRNELEDKLTSQLPCTRVIFSEQEVKEAIEDKTGRSFTWMNSTAHQENLK